MLLLSSSSGAKEHDQVTPKCLLYVKLASPYPSKFFEKKIKNAQLLYLQLISTCMSLSNYSPEQQLNNILPMCSDKAIAVVVQRIVVF